MYEKNGEKYFIVDGHCHFWDANPENWVAGQEQYAKGWIECFHAYMGLGPADTHWPLKKFMKYSEEDFVKDVFEDAGTDVAIMQSTYLKQWYTTGFNTAEAKNPKRSGPAVSRDRPECLHDLMSRHTAILE